MFLFLPVHVLFFLCAALRALDILSDEVLVDLTAAYRRTVSHLSPPRQMSQSASCFNNILVV